MTHVLITGADGYLGRTIASHLLSTTPLKLLLWVRAKDTQARRIKATRLSQLPGDRCKIIYGNLESAEPFADVHERRIRAIVHAAAATDFSVSQAKAHAINVEGSRKLFAWAGNCVSLERIVLLSTLYVSGLQSGLIGEHPLDQPQAFANHYEWSKWRAERLLCDEFNDLPWQIHRIATVMADNSSGHVVQYNALHNTLRLLYYGLLPVIPGDSATPIHMTCADSAARVCLRLLLDAPSHAVYHICNAGDAVLSLGELIGMAYQQFCNNDAGFRKQGIRKPLLCNQQAFAALREAARGFDSVLSQSLASIDVFAPQLFCQKSASTVRTTTYSPDIRSPDAAQVIPRVCQFLSQARRNSPGENRS